MQNCHAFRHFLLFFFLSGISGFLFWKLFFFLTLISFGFCFFSFILRPVCVLKKRWNEIFNFFWCLMARVCIASEEKQFSKRRNMRWNKSQQAERQAKNFPSLFSLRLDRRQKFSEKEKWKCPESVSGHDRDRTDPRSSVGGGDAGLLVLVVVLVAAAVVVAFVCCTAAWAVTANKQTPTTKTLPPEAFKKLKTKI